MAKPWQRSGGSLQMPGGMLEWRWSGQRVQDAIERADQQLHRQSDLVNLFLKRQEDLITIFIGGLLCTPNGVNDSTGFLPTGDIDKVALSPEKGVADLFSALAEAQCSRELEKRQTPPHVRFQTQSEGHLAAPLPGTQESAQPVDGIPQHASERTAASGQRMLSVSFAKEDMHMKKGDTMLRRLTAVGIHQENLIVTWVHWWATLQEPERTSRLARFVHSTFFEALCVVIIVLNTICMIGSTNYSIRNQTENEPAVFVIAEACFLAFYSSEIVLKIAVHRIYFFCNEHMLWNLFDLFIVVFSAVNAFILASLNNNLAFLRTFRILKLSKLFRIFRMIVILRDLRIMLSCVVNSFISLMWCFALLALIGVIFALFFVQSFTRHVTEQDTKLSIKQQEIIIDKFGSVQQGMVSLFMVATGGIDWLWFYDLVVSTGPMDVVALLFFIGFFHVSIFNIATGLFVEKAMKYGRPDQEMEILEHRKEAMNKVKSIKALCHQLDTDMSGSISRDKFMNCIRDPTVRYAFSLEGMDIRDAEAFFDMLSTITCSEHVDIETFVAGCLRMRGLATSIDLQTLGFELKLASLTNQDLNRQILRLVNLVNRQLQPRVSDRSRESDPKCASASSDKLACEPSDTVASEGDVSLHMPGEDDVDTAVVSLD